ncbi:MAG: PEGA domain-containing protein [Phycisphaerales bacterium]|jgi:hypothetical protein|nr:PEGA domain-containing protein [Phycisphaerales bacterium]
MHTAANLSTFISPASALPRLARWAMLIIVALGASFAGGCQTLSNGGMQAVSIETTPPGAIVEVAGRGTFITPTTISLPRNAHSTLWITKEGYLPQSVQLTARLDADRATPRAEFMSMVGAAVDAATGGSWTLVPDAVSVRLKPRAGTKPLPEDAPDGALAAQSTTDADLIEQDPGAASRAVIKTIETATGTASPGAPSKATTPMGRAIEYNLARLEHLRSTGQITEDEYATLKIMVMTTGAVTAAPTTP